MVSDNDDPDDRTDAVVHPRGFTKIRGTRYEAKSGTRIRIERQKRMHKFRSGYESVGHPVPIFTGTEKEARYVYDVLKEMFEDE